MTTPPQNIVDQVSLIYDSGNFRLKGSSVAKHNKYLYLHHNTFFYLYEKNIPAKTDPEAEKRLAFSNIRVVD